MITIISGTNRPNSQSLLLAKYYLEQLHLLGQEAQLLSLTDLPDNVIKSDMYGNRSTAFQPLQDMISNSSKFIFIVPEYNGSFPGVLKVFMDCCEYPSSFDGKKAALAGLSEGVHGNIRGIDHFSGVCNFMGITILPLKLHLQKVSSLLSTNGEVKITDQQIKQLIDKQLQQFIVF